MSRKIERTRPGQRQIPADPPALPVQVEDLVTGQPAQSQTDRVTESQSPRYLRMVRKEARVRRDQADALAALRHRITADRRERGQRGEPITDNTLIRVALDLLLARADRLAGATEDQLRDSVTDRVTD